MDNDEKKNKAASTGLINLTSLIKLTNQTIKLTSQTGWILPKARAGLEQPCSYWLGNPLDFSRSCSLRGLDLADFRDQKFRLH